jgi:hypothetical protein
MSNEPRGSFWITGLERAAAVPRCAARRKDGGACRKAAMANGRCDMHGGKSTGPRTTEGLERSRKANWRHGIYSKERKARRREARAMLWALRDLIRTAGF